MSTPRTTGRAPRPAPAAGRADPLQRNPLDGVGTIRLKIGLLVGLSVLTTALVAAIGSSAGVPLWFTLPVTVGVALAFTQWLARGMTAPLREMTAASARMASGDYAQRVTQTSADEVGRLARAFNSMAADLAAVDEQHRQLIATVSHELRTPLAAQRLLLENLVDGVVLPGDSALESALAQSERLSELVEDLLDLARIDAGAAGLTLAPVHVGELVNRAVAEARLGARPVTYAVEVPTHLTVTGDDARLAQVVANLLDNAARHSPAGGTVRVQVTAEGEEWSLTVTDEGSGIPPGSEEHVFTRFAMAGDDDGGGTGLGLAIASWVCEMHGGSIAALPPAPDATGARIRAVLPRRPRTATGLAPLVTADRDATPTTSTPSPAKEPLVSSTPVIAHPSAGVPSAAGLPAASARGLEGALRHVWPTERLATAPLPLLGSLAIGALAAALLPERRLGLAAFVVLVLGGGLVLGLTRRRARPWTLVSAALCVVLGSFVVLRDAGWLTFLSLVVVGVLVTTALTDARRVLEIVAGAASWVLSAVRGLPLLSRTLAALTRHRLLWPVVRTAAISLVALVVFGGLFASGDAVFGAWVGHLVPDLAWDSIIARTFVLVGVGGSVLAACYLALNPPQVDRVALGEPRPVAKVWEWLVPVGLVVAVFAGFVIAQTAAMWGGSAYVREVTGMTYAEYVHQGFGQLTVATALTLATIALTVRKARQHSARDRLLLRLVLGVLCALTLVVVASALLRMSVYQQAYGYTVLRVLVDAFELWLGLVVVLVVVAGIRWSGRWLPRAALLSGALLLVVLGLGNTEAWVAERNIAHYEATGTLDTAYLATLGADATPTIAAGLPTHLARCALRDGQRETDDVLSWNLSRARAQEVSGGALSMPPVGECP